MEHPAFYWHNRKCRGDIRKFLFCIQQSGEDFRNKKILVIAEDGGYLLRNMIRAGSREVVFCTKAVDFEWCREVLKFFHFSKKQYAITDGIGGFDIKNFDCVIADLPSEDIWNSIKEAAPPECFVRIKAAWWDGTHREKEWTELERYWMGDFMAVTVGKVGEQK